MNHGSFGSWLKQRNGPEDIFSQYVDGAGSYNLAMTFSKRSRFQFCTMRLLYVRITPIGWQVNFGGVFTDNLELSDKSEYVGSKS